MKAKKEKPKLFIDMDDTTAQFIGDKRLNHVTIIHTHFDYPEMHIEGFFRELDPMPNAIESVRKLIASEKFDIYILSVPLATSPGSYFEKVEWIKEHIPELLKKIVFTQDKGLIRGDYLVDDSLAWKDKWEKNGGKFIHFNPRKNPVEQWDKIVDFLLNSH